MPTTRSERALVARARAGDPVALRALYEAHAPRVFALVRRMAGDDTVAEDWAQDAWIRIFASLPRFRGEARFSTWAYRIAVNAALNGYRSARRRDVVESSATPPSDSTPGAETLLLRVRLGRALDELPSGMRQVLVLHDVKGLRHEDIGVLLGISAGTSKSQLFRARAKLRAALAAERIPPAAERAA
jgi:RNA polymerase sigma-70 factor (ECF subfamily)